MPKPGTTMRDLVPARDADRVLTPEDVQARLPQHEGRPAFSRAWVLAHVAPEGKRKLGRRVYWLESAFTAWYQRWIAGDVAAPRRGRAA